MFAYYIEMQTRMNLNGRLFLFVPTVNSYPQCVFLLRVGSGKVIGKRNLQNRYIFEMGIWHIKCMLLFSVWCAVCASVAVACWAFVCLHRI